MMIDVEIRATGKFGSKGETLEVLFGDEILSSGVSPEFQACRKLKERGCTGKIRFWRHGKSTHDLEMGIEWGAGHCVVETAKLSGLRFAKWVPDPRFSKDFAEGERMVDEDAFLACMP